MKNGKKGQSGFTLVEIAIVLVVIGLLLGGVLKGQEMISQAKIKNVINDFNGITAAYYSYQDRYKMIPGDDNTASPRWTGTVNGNANGQIQGNYNNSITAAPTAAQESNLFWQHLRLAGFVGGVSTGNGSGSQPTNGVGGKIGVQTNAAATNLGFTTTILCSANLPDKIAIAVDSQMDDQSAITGQIRGQLQAGPNPNAAAAPAVEYAENGQNQYLLCKAL